MYVALIQIFHLVGNGIQASCADKLKNPAFEVPVVKARSLEDL